MDISKFIVGQLRANCYLVKSGNDAIVIDSGDDGQFLSEKILAENLKIRAILATHGHFDHVLAAEELKMNFKAPFLISRKDEFILKKARKSAVYWTGVDLGLDPARVDKFLQKGDKIRFGKEYLEVIETPGHTPGSVCFYSKKNKVLFSGDTVFKDGFGRTDFSYSSQEKLIESVKKLSKLSGGIVVYPGHGEKTTLKEISIF